MKKILLLSIFLAFFIDNYVVELIKYIKNPFFDIIMPWFSNELTVFSVLVFISALFLYEERKNKFIPILFISFFTGVFISLVLKLVIARIRPEGMAYLVINFFGQHSLPDYSFPSMHAVMAFSVLPILQKEFKKLKLFWLFFCIMIVISRIYLNQHYLSDVLAGAFLGYIIGKNILKLGEKHNVGKNFSVHL